MPPSTTFLLRPTPCACILAARSTDIILESRQQHDFLPYNFFSSYVYFCTLSYNEKSLLFVIQDHSLHLILYDIKARLQNGHSWRTKINHLLFPSVFKLGFNQTHLHQFFLWKSQVLPLMQSLGITHPLMRNQMNNQLTKKKDKEFSILGLDKQWWITHVLATWQHDWGSPQHGHWCEYSSKGLESLRRATVALLI